MTYCILFFRKNLQTSLAGGGEEIRKTLGGMSRRFTLLQVNEKVLIHKQQLLQEREAGLKKVCVARDEWVVLV